LYFAGAAPTPEAIADLRRTLLLDRSPFEQFLAFMAHLAHGDLGHSLVTGQAVSTDLMSRLPNTLEADRHGTPARPASLPSRSASGRRVRRGGVLDHSLRVLSAVALSVPAFFSALMLVFLFYYLAGLAPAPLGRLDAMAFPPPTHTGFLLVDTVDRARLGDLAGCARPPRPAGHWPWRSPPSGLWRG